MSITRFHIAFHGDDLDAAHRFYGTTPGCNEGRSSASWIDSGFSGNQIVAHLNHPRTATSPSAIPSTVAMFFLDPAGNAFEFKIFADISQLFAK